MENRDENEFSLNSPSRSRKAKVPEYSKLGRKIMQMKRVKLPEEHPYSIIDLNNFIGADRKLIINDGYEFWVHDAVLAKYSKYFKENLQSSDKLRQETILFGDNQIKRSYIYLPHCEYFFDMLLWIYTRDSNRLSVSADEPKSFLCILNLGIFLEMNDEFFKALLNNCEIKLDLNLFEHSLWSRFSFTFQVLQKLLKLIPDSQNFLKVMACLYWLKEDQTIKVNNGSTPEREHELLTSKDFFNVKNLIKSKALLTDISIQELKLTKFKFEHLFPVLDTEFLVSKFIANTKTRIICRVCRNISNNILEFAKVQCENRLYHPRSIVNLQRQIHSSCMHENCPRKILINEYPCCHRGPHYEGCLQSNGKHVLVFDNESENKPSLPTERCNVNLV